MNLKIRNVHTAIIVLFVLAVPMLLHAQITFERYYGIGGCYSEGRSVFQKNDHGYVFGGTTQFPSTELYFYLVRTDSFGDTLWTRFYGGDERDYGYSMDMTSDGGYILAGYTKSFGVDSVDVYVVRTDSSGDTLWTRTYGGLYDDRSSSIKQTSDGGFIIAGYTNSYGAGGYDVYLIKIDSVGDTIWTRTYGDTLDDFGRCVEITSDNKYVVVGETWSFVPGYCDVYLIMTDTLGDTVSTRTYGRNHKDIGNYVQETADGGFIITGSSINSDMTYVYLIKTDSLGDSLWAKIIKRDLGTGEEIEIGYSVDQTLDGGYIITGRVQALSVGPRDLILMKTDSFGDTSWTKLYGYLSGASETGYSVKQTNEGGYIISGNSSGAGHGQAYLIKTDNQGNVAVQEGPSQRQIASPYLHCSPNPFSYSTTISFSGHVDYDMSAKARIYDATGRLIKDFPQQKLGFANGFRVTWDGRNGYGNRVRSGIYFVVLQANDCRFSEKLILLH